MASVRSSLRIKNRLSGDAVLVPYVRRLSPRKLKTGRKSNLRVPTSIPGPCREPTITDQADKSAKEACRRPLERQFVASGLETVKAKRNKTVQKRKDVNLKRTTKKLQRGRTKTSVVKMTKSRKIFAKKKTATSKGVDDVDAAIYVPVDQPLLDGMSDTGTTSCVVTEHRQDMISSGDGFETLTQSPSDHMIPVCCHVTKDDRQQTEPCCNSGTSSIMDVEISSDFESLEQTNVEEEYPQPSTPQQKMARHLARQRQLRGMRAREAAMAREERLLQRKGLLSPSKKETSKKIVWKNESDLVQVFIYSPSKDEESSNDDDITVC